MQNKCAYHLEQKMKDQNISEYQWEQFIIISRATLYVISNKQNKVSKKWEQLLEQEFIIGRTSLYIISNKINVVLEQESEQIVIIIDRTN
jgi:hypothetical protein